MSNEQPPVRKIIPYKSGKRPSTFRRLNIDFAGTALEEALNEQEQREQETNIPETSPKELQTEQLDGPLPPVTTTPHQSPLPVFEISNSDQEEAEGSKGQQNQKFRQASLQRREETPPVTTTPQNTKKSSSSGIAPERDFNRRANSLERDALPAGLFPGSTKKVYDVLYLKTRGAIVPVKRINASRRDLLTWTGIRNLKTIDNHIRYLMAKGLIVRHWELGSNEGSGYEVRLPEEINNQQPPIPTSSGYSPPDTTSQNLGIPTTQKMGTGGEGQTVVNTDTYSSPKTSFNTNTEKTDDEAFAKFNETMKKAVKNITGKETSTSESERWNELAELLAAEAQIAAARTTSVSSVPAFLTEHLRRRLWKMDKKPAGVEVKSVADETQASLTIEQIKNCPDCAGTGFYYPNGYEGGVSKCKHEKLQEKGNS